MKSQRQKILEHLISGLPITDSTARDRYHCTRLADVIWKIRKQYRVESTLLPTGKSCGTRSKFAVYHMSKSEIVRYNANKGE